MLEANGARLFPEAGDAAQMPSTAASNDASKAESLELVRAFMSIHDAALRRSVINMIRVLALEPKQ
jgi:hypothetical protein